jgi:hypothetical protein
MKKQLVKWTAFAVIAGALFSACNKDEKNVKIDDGTPSDIVTITDNTTELKGQMKGTLKEGKTYFLKGDLIIPENEEIIVEPGVTLIAEKDESNIGYEITVFGSLIAQGTQAKPILMTVPEADRGEANVFKGLWGGIQCDEKAKLVLLRWVRLEYLGDQGGPGTPRAGRIRYGIWTQNPETELIMENCWIYGCKDDVYRPNGAKINLVANTFEFCGENGGDGLNCKAGTVGNIAYNLFIGGATNAFKPSNEGASPVQSNIFVYNNTILNGSWRRPGYSRGANINYEVGARGESYNNIIVNCKRGMRVLEDGDLPNIKFDYNLYYATHQEMVDEFIPSDAVNSTQAVLGDNMFYGAAKENDPMFVSYNIDLFTMAQYQAGENQPADMNKVGSHNFRLKPGSPCLNKGTTSFTPLSVNWVYATGNRAPTIMQPSKDLGCYPSSGNGNKHN